MTQTVDNSEVTGDEPEILGRYESPRMEEEATETQPEEEKAEPEAKEEAEAEPVEEETNEQTEEAPIEEDHSEEQDSLFQNKKVQRRFNRLTKQRESWRSKAEESQSLAEQYKQQLEQLQQPQSQQTENLQDIEQRIRAELEQQYKDNSYQNEFDSAVKMAQQKVSALPENQRQMISNLDIQLQPESQLHLLKSDKVVELSLELARNDDFAERLESAPTAEAQKAVIDMFAQYALNKPEPKVAKKVPPKPAPEVQANKTPVSETDPSKMTMKEYERWSMGQR